MLGRMSTIDSRTVHRRMTLEEYKALPEGPPKFEFENGEVIPMTQPMPEHQDVLVELCPAMRTHVGRHRLGRVFMEPDVYLPDGRGYIPDVVVLSEPRLALYDVTTKSIHGSPDLCVEILSTRPSRDLVDKLKVYADNQVPWYWVVDPMGLTIEEYRLTPGGYERTALIPAGQAFHPALFPGFTVDLKKLLESPADEP
jgi:Uma2 family endonuclease